MSPLASPFASAALSVLCITALSFAATDNSTHQPPLVTLAVDAERPVPPPANWTRSSIGSPACGYTAYKQCDKRWGGNQLGTSSNTICSAGCAMSSVAMYVTTRGHSKDPGQLNEWLKSNGGYAKGDLLVWSAADKLGVSFQSMETGVSR